MERFINDQLLLFPRPGVFAGGDSQIALLGIEVVDFKEEIPRVAFLDEERVGDEFGGYIGDVLRPEERIDPALQVVEVEGIVTAVNADRPLLTLGDEGNAAFHPDDHAADEADG